MPTATSHIAGLEVSSTGALFITVLAVHVVASLVCFFTGLGAAFSDKGPGRHVLLGRIYYRALGVACASAAALAAVRFAKHWPLLLLAVAAFAAATVGVQHRRRHRPGDTGHIAAMGGSYIVLITGFYVDNGKSLPLWRDLPTAAYWIIPALVGMPLIARAVTKARRISELIAATTVE